MKTLAQAIMRLRDAYPQRPLSESSIRLYGESLLDLDEQAVYDAVEDLIRTEQRPPTIAHVREHVAERALRLPSPEEAWAMAISGVQPPVPEVRQSMVAVGGQWVILHGDHPDTVRAHFWRDYQTRRARLIREYQAGGPNGRAFPPAGTLLSLDARRAREIPETTRMQPRLIVLRAVQRAAGRDLEPSTPLERQDAIRYLEQQPHDEADPVYREAFRVFEEANP